MPPVLRFIWALQVTPPASYLTPTIRGFHEVQVPTALFRHRNCPGFRDHPCAQSRRNRPLPRRRVARCLAYDERPQLPVLGSSCRTAEVAETTQMTRMRHREMALW